MRRRRSPTHPAAKAPRPSRRIYDEANDPYAERAKLPEATVCPSCGLVVREGRWTPGAALPGAKAHPCPACRRIADDYPDGIVSASGAFAAAHRAELIDIARRIEERERSDHPLKRCFPIRSEGEELVVRTTHRKLAEGIAVAWERAYHGKLERIAGEPPQALRLRWQRD
jgi:hypothetical protein